MKKIINGIEYLNEQILDNTKIIMIKEFVKYLNNNDIFHYVSLLLGNRIKLHIILTYNSMENITCLLLDKEYTLIEVKNDLLKYKKFCDITIIKL